MKNFICIILYLLPSLVVAQSITISPGTAENPAMISTIGAYQRGFEIPSMPSVQRLNIENPIDGLTVFDTDRKALCTYNNSVWYCASKDVIEDRKPQTVFASDSTLNDGFGDEVDMLGNNAAIAAPRAEVGSNTNQGAVYLFSYDVSSKKWYQTQKLLAADGQPNDNFGSSVFLSNNYLIVGANGCNTKTGAVYVFKKISGVWTQEAKIVPSDGATNDGFGSSIDFIINTSVSPNVPMILVSSPGDDLVSPAVSNIGSAYLYSYNSTTLWTLTQKFMDASGYANDGIDLTVKFKDPDIFVLGKSYADNGTISSERDKGKIQTYRKTTGSFTLIQTIIGYTNYINLGSDIEISGDYMVAGQGIDPPQLYKYNTSTNLWGSNTFITSPYYDVYFGATLAISGDKIFVRDTYMNYGIFFKITAGTTANTSYQTVGFPNFCYHSPGGRATAIDNGKYIAGEAGSACYGRPGRVNFGEYNNNF